MAGTRTLAELLEVADTWRLVALLDITGAVLVLTTFKIVGLLELTSTVGQLTDTEGDMGKGMGGVTTC